ncbi:hypothetical protein HanXRQr2_Chr10g0426611 [Helianthus annuus]|uniref:Uncharacterized protein n=1 Tax=Helianthus annuus TaxID=4232 RepID=A0A251TI02_HELAN|nr:hypothetical protein HanXRQr2_Chr10g0426611 [Helianthus annuus]KAJ0512843.1 hypothetical protein HanHA300_Chr10g0350711 [Helianthus annuus]KAJ0528967.1 hypothetical protein HanHA89_Chr10g0372411 [Helianthus annuus]KAJ0695883.1 hypothetical protein HanLR1_Chr10g0350631 [Helianthus annuus]
MNRVLLAKWWWGSRTEKGRLWQEVIAAVHHNIRLHMRMLYTATTCEPMPTTKESFRFLGRYFALESLQQKTSIRAYVPKVPGIGGLDFGDRSDVCVRSGRVRLLCGELMFISLVWAAVERR